MQLCFCKALATCVRTQMAESSVWCFCWEMEQRAFIQVGGSGTASHPPWHALKVHLVAPTWIRARGSSGLSGWSHAPHRTDFRALVAVVTVRRCFSAVHRGDPLRMYSTSERPFPLGGSSSKQQHFAILSGRWDCEATQCCSIILYRQRDSLSFK
uniref:Uncharacterized protein n=1 Tax=Ixodes ricinus TaxID=34613 RepID=A0A6B0UW72_IXORI